ncbi:MAG: porin family protein [Fluviicola sp.]
MNYLKTLLIVLTFGSFSSFRAQNSMFDLGLEGGPNLSTVFISTNYSNVKTNPAIFGSAGFIFQYNFKNFLSIKTGLSYQRKGFRTSGTYINEDGNIYESGVTSSRLDYITFPVLVKASFGKKVQFFINAGPYAGYLLEKTDRLNIPGSSETINDPGTSGLSRWDFGAAGGIGIAIPIRTYWVVSVEGRNYTGLSDITPSPMVKWFTNTIDLRVGVAYKIGFYKEK